MLEQWRQSITDCPQPPFPCTTQGEKVEEGGWREGVYSLFSLSPTSLACK